jgi:hypothetical protein
MLDASWVSLVLIFIFLLLCIALTPFGKPEKAV